MDAVGESAKYIVRSSGDRAMPLDTAKPRSISQH
jgi:hypothetical protein